MRRALPFGIALLVASHASLVSAQSISPTPPPTTASTDNVLTLRDGSTVTGRIVELRPGEFVIVVLPAGNRTIAWSDIVRAAGPSFPGGYDTAPPDDVAPVAADNLHPGPGRVPLVVESTGSPLEVSEAFAADVEEGGVVSQTIGATLCTTPCTLYVPPTSFAFRTRARGVRANHVTVTVPPSGLRVRLRAASSTRYYGGIGAIGGGTAFVATGLVLLIYAATVPTYRVAPGMPSPAPGGAPYYAAGGIFLGLGAAAVVAGILLVTGAHNGLDSSSPIATPRGPQLSFDVSPNGFGAAMTLHF